MHICLLRLSALGDVCNAIPLMRRLQDNLSSVTLTWVIGEKEASLVSDIENIELIRYRKSGGWRALREQLTGRYFDVLLLLQPTMRAHLASLLINADRRIGCDGIHAREGHRWFVNETVSSPDQAHVMESFLVFSNAMGVMNPTSIRWDIPISAPAHAMAAYYIPPGHPVLIVSPCASESKKIHRNWPVERYIEVIEFVIERLGWQVILTGSGHPTERHYESMILKQSRFKPVSLIGQTSVKELLALLSRAKAVLCPDSSPAHLAAAVNTSVVGLYAATNLRRSGPPPYARQWIVDRYEDSLKHFTGKSPDQVSWGAKVHHPRAMELIAVEEVIDVLTRLALKA